MVFGAENSGGDQKLLCPSSPSLVLSLRAHWRRWDDALFCRKLDTWSYCFNLRFTQQPELGKRRVRIQWARCPPNLYSKRLELIRIACLSPNQQRSKCSPEALIVRLHTFVFIPVTSRWMASCFDERLSSDWNVDNRIAISVMMGRQRSFLCSVNSADKRIILKASCDTVVATGRYESV